MTIEEAVGIRFGDIDAKAGERVSFEEFYRRVIEYLGGLDAVLPYIPFSLKEIQRALANGDENFNTLPLKKWDAAAGYLSQGWACIPTHSGLTILLRQKSIKSYSCSQNVCILKEAALEWAERGF